PHHEVFGLDGVDVFVAGPGAVVALLTLRVKTHPAEAAAQIRLVDAVETLFCVDVFDAGPHIERCVIMLHPLAVIKRLTLSQRPLALAASLGGTCCGHLRVLLREGCVLGPRRSPAVRSGDGGPAARPGRPAGSASVGAADG